LVESIDKLYRARVEDIWSGDLNYMPKDQQIWCEVWVDNESLSSDEFFEILSVICEKFDIPLNSEAISFPQRTIFLVKTNFHQLAEIINYLPYIAEVKKAIELNSFWLDQTIIEREEWIEDLCNKRLAVLDSNNFITILDSGVNNGHDLLKNVLLDKDKLSADINWGVNDQGHNGHGTKMAGVIAYGDLNDVLGSNKSVEIPYLLESVKILPANKTSSDDSKIPIVTKNAINTAIANNPFANRIICMAVTSKDQNDFGKPSAWSATVDQLAFSGNFDEKLLFIISAGNVRHEDDWKNYPESNLDSSVEDPAQAWNAITVGAYTKKILPNKTTIAKKFELSPFSRTSSSWESQWPIKPEVIFEGGNLLNYNNVPKCDHDLEVLTTSNLGNINQLSTINATSSATALASKFLGEIRSIYPNAWPETLRALMIHSSSWPKELISQFNISSTKSTEALRLLKIIGYGVPNLEKAKNCNSNYLTFISEQELQPFSKQKSKNSTQDIHYYDFPWPDDILTGLGESEVTLKVTLSYFIEPNPGNRYTSKYSYQSSALRFLLINPSEDFENFKIRTNKANQDKLKAILKKESLEDTDFNKNTGNNRWALGADNVFKGSIHSNYWKGTAAEIAKCNKLAIFPQASGWWRELKKQKKANDIMRYSLIVSIETPEGTSDIYTLIANKIKSENMIKV
tara:strand:+ start:7779 stop:9833 length:2055 start_codon:yes stop_codon:yes gene_type:complete